MVTVPIFIAAGSGIATCGICTNPPFPQGTDHGSVPANAVLVEMFVITMQIWHVPRCELLKHCSCSPGRISIYQRHILVARTITTAILAPC